MHKLSPLLLKCSLTEPVFHQRHLEAYLGTYLIPWVVKMRKNREPRGYALFGLITLIQHFVPFSRVAQGSDVCLYCISAQIRRLGKISFSLKTLSKQHFNGGSLENTNNDNIINKRTIAASSKSILTLSQVWHYSEDPSLKPTGYGIFLYCT